MTHGEIGIPIAFLADGKVVLRLGKVETHDPPAIEAAITEMSDGVER